MDIEIDTALVRRIGGQSQRCSDSLTAVSVADGSGGELGGNYSSVIALLQAAVGEVAKATARAAENASHAADLHDTVEEQISDSLSAILPRLD